MLTTVAENSEPILRTERRDYSFHLPFFCLVLILEFSVYLLVLFKFNKKIEILERWISAFDRNFTVKSKN